MNQNDELMNAASELNKAVREFRRETKTLMRLIMHKVEQAQGRELIRIEKAAELLDVSERTVQRMADRGELTRYNKDGSRKVDNAKTNVYYDFNEVFMRASDT